MSLKSKIKNWDISSNKDLDHVIEMMLSNIGSTDSELRDSIIYNKFGTLITTDSLNRSTMEHILNVCLENLFYNIEEPESDSVFTRSFSALVIALILQKDRKNLLLSDDLLNKAFECSIHYLELEKDIRGFVKDKGWAHSIAHGADLLTEAVKHPKFDQDLHFDCLNVVKLCLLNKGNTMNAPYIDDEEERLIFVLEALTDNGVSDDEIIKLIYNISDELNDLLSDEDYSLNFFYKRSIILKFFHTYFFRLSFNEDCKNIRKTIYHVLKKWHH
ncbi:DUF2785 domain-containing protein [Piscibacillus salipiscarius]|uniref:DUF2785 domain-containing protein n=1 Tax=Piscibacillus salipiscarius TaxID=299480 RepID=A0ABW5Q7T8_9BACI|nr:DUF2785 domain-containing protein [Piscibacillus salipiscarius]